MAIGMGFSVPCVMSTSSGPLPRCGACAPRCWAWAPAARSIAKRPTNNQHSARRPARQASARAGEVGARGTARAAGAGQGGKAGIGMIGDLGVGLAQAHRAADSMGSRLEHVARIEVEHDIFPKLVLGG